MLDMLLLQQCAPQIDPIVAHAIIKTESSFNPWAIGVNRGSRISQPTSYASAVNTAKNLLKAGGNIDLGLAQINSNNLRWLGLSVEQVFDPCTNMKAMQTVYNHCYAKAGNSGHGTRIQRAFSCYNTGNTSKGFSNGYVNKTTRHYNEFLARFARQRPTTQTSMTATNRLANNATALATYTQALMTAETQGQQHTKQISPSEPPVEPYLAQVVETDPEQEEVTAVNVTNRHHWDIFGDF